MFPRNVLVGCLFLVAGIAWPTTTILRGLSHISEVYKTAAAEHHPIPPKEHLGVVAAVEQSVSSILGGLVCGLFGIGLVLGAKHDSQQEPTLPVELCE